MKPYKPGAFLIQGLAAVLIGSTLGTAIFLVWLDFYAAFLDKGPYPGPPFGRLLILPMALPIALFIAIPVAILPTYFLGATLNWLLHHLNVSKPLLCAVFGSFVGGATGALLLYPFDRGALPGLIYGSAIGGSWFVSGWVLSQVSRKSS